MDGKLTIALKTIQDVNDPFEKARAMKDSIYEVPVSLISLASHLGVSPTYISNYLRLLRVPAIVRDGYYGQLISLSHLFIIARVKDEADMIRLYERVLEQNLPTSKTEELVRDALHSIKSEGDHLSYDRQEAIIHSLKKISPALEVKIIQTRIRAKITISVKASLTKTTEVLNKFGAVITGEED